ncbi:CobW family GTP-binding protein [Candidatus Formimonas warabiya]|uniref:GTP-binding protein n=1 Tax=Formimonas warabiya TaxID=1761012 RepID=A0A3G1KSW9_FORW1|nr:GTP-binding protein [Candidatus Formimonas warabiya]ATW25549.1 hypothetical protein DCMF_12980 [Candidatus Formimonas warabiya]
MVRLDIVSGFLGAGKTTFIRKVMEACISRREKIVLVENEFGQVSIDSALLETEHVKIYELLQGCVCCTLKGDFFQTIKNILPQKPDRIIFEPSGIFIFNEIFDLLKDPEISSQCCINSVTTIVDGQHFFQQNKRFSPFFESQISHASTLVLSKTPSLSTKEIKEISDALRQQNDTASLVTKSWDDFLCHEIMLILDGNIKYALPNLLDEIPDCSTGHGHHKHEFESVGVRTAKIFEIRELENILGQFPQAQFGNILRGKGIIKTPDHCVEFSYVNGQYHISQSKSTIAGMASFIGMGLKKEKLLALFG